MVAQIRVLDEQVNAAALEKASSESAARFASSHQGMYVFVIYNQVQCVLVHVLLLFRLMLYTCDMVDSCYCCCATCAYTVAD